MLAKIIKLDKKTNTLTISFFDQVDKLAVKDLTVNFSYGGILWRSTKLIEGGEITKIYLGKIFSTVQKENFSELVVKLDTKNLKLIVNLLDTFENILKKDELQVFFINDTLLLSAVM